jgi:hypothetical protein
MYGRFLHQAADITGNRALKGLGDRIVECGDRWETMAYPCKDAMDVDNPESLIEAVPDNLLAIANDEEAAFTDLEKAIPKRTT